MWVSFSRIFIGNDRIRVPFETYAINRFLHLSTVSLVRRSPDHSLFSVIYLFFILYEVVPLSLQLPDRSTSYLCIPVLFVPPDDPTSQVILGRFLVS